MWRGHVPDGISLRVITLRTDRLTSHAIKLPVRDLQAESVVDRWITVIGMWYLAPMDEGLNCRMEVSTILDDLRADVHIPGFMCHNAYIFQEERSRSRERTKYRNFHSDIYKGEIARQILVSLYVLDTLKFAYCSEIVTVNLKHLSTVSCKW